MSDLKISIPEEYIEEIEYYGDDLMLSFIIDSIKEGCCVFSLAQWLHLSVYVDEQFGMESEISLWLYDAIYAAMHAEVL